MFFRKFLIGPILLIRDRILGVWMSLRQGRSFSSIAGQIVVGPWFGEVGFELLYWIPYVTYLKELYGWDPKKICVISRGNSSAWYSALGPVQYRDILSILSPTEFRAANSSRKEITGRFKQTVLNEEEKNISISLLGQTSNECTTFIHPSMMYDLFAAYWAGDKSANWAEKKLTFNKIPKPNFPLPKGLIPGRFIAVKFYFSASLPATKVNRDLMDQVVLSLAEKNTVALLHMNLKIDDHTDSEIQAIHHPNVIQIAEDVHPEQNLLLQTAIVANAKQFVGTYGGFSYLAPLLGVPSYSCYSSLSFQPAHNDIMLRALLQIQANDLDSPTPPDFICMTLRGLVNLIK